MQPRYALNKNKYLLDHELNHLNQLLDKMIEDEPRNCLCLMLALKTGARAQELLNLTHSSLNPAEQTVLIQGLKGSNDREIPLPPPLFKRLQNYSQALSANKVPHTEEDKRLFPISYNRLRQIWQDYRPVSKKFHALRHTFAIQLYKKTKDIRLVQVALGHRNVMNTMIYADYVYTQSELRRLIL